LWAYIANVKKKVVSMDQKASLIMSLKMYLLGFALAIIVLLIVLFFSLKRKYKK